MAIILDTNFVIYLIKHKIADQARELGRLVLPSTVEEELKKPTLGSDERRYASAALELLDSWKVEKIPAEGRSVDDSVLNLAKGLKKEGKEILVATLDAGLARKLGKEGIRTVGIKRGKIVSAK